MPWETDMANADTETRVLPSADEKQDVYDDGPFVVILYNDDVHDIEEVVSQIQKATGYDLERCVRIMIEAHTRGRAIAFTGSQEKCNRAAAVLRQIRLQVETDKF